MKEQKIAELLPWEIGTFAVWILVSWLLKHLYSLLRSLWIAFYMAWDSPLVMWEILRSNVDDLAEKFAALVESVKGDMVYRTLDWFSQPIDWGILVVWNSWYFLRNRDVYQRWLRRKRYQRRHSKR